MINLEMLKQRIHWNLKDFEQISHQIIEYHSRDQIHWQRDSKRETAYTITHNLDSSLFAFIELRPPAKMQMKRSGYLREPLSNTLHDSSAMRFEEEKTKQMNAKSLHPYALKRMKE